ncbi:putative RNA recognition motif domain, nucleotide-binding alpha-beta plait domain superfamily [Helianthus annuus]|nr:putative RNA recognition motif domain, nucleotide-binding alpha-beta plait domain superfamily [Helianthus annuus]
MNDGGGEPDNGGPWCDVQYRKNTRSRGDGIEWTFLVQNISDKVTRNVLWRAFKPFGFVSDVYVARKRDSRGSCFRFVRYVEVENVKETLVSMNTVIMFGMKASVSLAKYDKEHKKINYAPDMLGRNVWRPKVWQQEKKIQDEGNSIGGQHSSKNQPFNQGPSPKPFTQDGRSYADLFKGDSIGNNNGAKVVTVEVKGSLYTLHCIGRSIMGIAKKVMTISKMRQAIEDEGMNEVGLSFLGGVTYLLTFRDKEFAKVCMDLQEGFFKSVFSKHVLWNGEEVPYSRLVTLNINGVPFIIRDNILFDNIGGLFGEVVQKSSFSWQEEDNSSGSVMVVTSIPSKIEEAVVIKWNNKTIVVWITESAGHWIPEIDVSSLLGSQDSNQKMESDSDAVSVDSEELEEGEINQNLENSGSRQDDVLEIGRSEKSPVVNEQSVERQETVEDHGGSSLNVGGNTKGLHGNLSQAAHVDGTNDILPDN